MADIDIVTREGTRYRVGGDADGFGCHLFRGRKRLMTFAENQHTGSMVIQQLHEVIKASGETSPIPPELVNRALRRKPIKMAEIEIAFSQASTSNRPAPDEQGEEPNPPAVR